MPCSHCVVHLIFLCVVSHASLPALCQQLRAGAAKAVITPALRSGTVYLAGFGHDRIATGINDDLYVRCVALQAGGNTVVLCAADLIGLFHSNVLKIRRRFSAQVPGNAFLVVACTHTHAGPDAIGLWGPTARQTGVDKDYLDKTERLIADTALRAVRSMQPARMQLGRDDHPLLGSLQGVDRPPYVKDPFLFAMRLIAVSTGQTIATIVNWSDHPETLGRGNTAMTADYPHWLCGYLERKVGELAVFFSRAVGKVSPLGSDVVLQDPETGAIAQDGTWLKARLLGTTIGELAVRALQSGETAVPDQISVQSTQVFVPLRNERFRLADAIGIFGDRRPLFTNKELDSSFHDSTIEGIGAVRLPLGNEIETEVDYVQLRAGHRVLAEIVTVPGEIYPELVNGGMVRYPGADYPDAPFEPVLRSHLKSRYQFVLGLANDEIGYLIPKAEWDDQPPWLQNRPERWYGEINSVGPDAAGAVLRALVSLTK
ncbi:MAG: hypothetical protein ACE14M_06130 [Terriglobales bacterium]